MLTTIKSYIILALVLALLGGGIYISSLQKDVMALHTEVATYRLAAEQNLKAKEKADASCLVTVDTLNTYYGAHNAFQTSQQLAGDAINALPTLTLKEKANEAPTKPQSFADDDRLSPDTMRLLDRAYCDGDKDGCASPAE